VCKFFKSAQIRCIFGGHVFRILLLSDIRARKVSDSDTLRVCNENLAIVQMPENTLAVLLQTGAITSPLARSGRPWGFQQMPPRPALNRLEEKKLIASRWIDPHLHCTGDCGLELRRGGSKNSLNRAPFPIARSISCIAR